LILRDRSTANNGTINERRYAMQDGNWNTIAICDTTGSVGERYAYSAYGSPVFMNGTGTVQSASAIDFETLYAGYRFDGNSPQMYYVRNRFLLPMIGTWNRRDPLVLSSFTSLLAYLDGKAISSVDTLGLYEFKVVNVNPQSTYNGKWIYQHPVLENLLTLELENFQGKTSSPPFLAQGELFLPTTRPRVGILCRTGCKNVKFLQIFSLTTTDKKGSRVSENLQQLWIRETRTGKNELYKIEVQNETTCPFQPTGTVDYFPKNDPTPWFSTSEGGKMIDQPHGNPAFPPDGYVFETCAFCFDKDMVKNGIKYSTYPTLGCFRWGFHYVRNPATKEIGSIWHPVEASNSPSELMLKALKRYREAHPGLSEAILNGEVLVPILNAERP